MASRKKSRVVSTWNVGLALIIFILAIFIWGYARYTPTATTQTVFQGETTETINAKGISVFEEELMTSDKKGIPVVNYPDGERIVAKTHVASLYSGDIDEGKSTQIGELNERINYLETNARNLQEDKKTEKSLNETLINKMKQISYYSVMGNFENIQREDDEIKSIVATSNSGDITLQLEELKAQRADFESSISGQKEDYISKKAGTIYSTLDGYETTITPKTTSDTNPDTFLTLWNSKPVDYSTTDGAFVFGKIVNNFEVTVLSLVDSKDINGIEEGQTVYIRFKDRNSDSIPATVKKIANTGKTTLVTLNVTQNTEDFMAERKFEFQFIKKIHHGLKIPQSALKTAGENNTVLVIRDSIVCRKKIEIISRENDYVIVKENNADKDSVLLYDLVITSSKNLSEGQIITDYK